MSPVNEHKKKGKAQQLGSKQYAKQIVADLGFEE